MFEFKKSQSMKINVKKEQECQISRKTKIENAFKDDNVFAFDIYYNNEIIGFVMFKKFKDNTLFLWNYAIDSKYQNQNLGTKALKELIDILKNDYKKFVTTYTQGNSHAKHIYEKLGFIETVVINEPDCKEVNMELEC